MAIPKVIYQTFKTQELPWLTQWYIKRFKRKNPEYSYEFYDDERINKFFKEEFDESVFTAYQKLNIGAAKADMFRYAILYRKGGVYLDIDSSINRKLDDFIRPDDSAVLTLEGDPKFFAQWAMIYEAGHPFLKRTLELVVENITLNRYPHSVHEMTGPSAYTKAIRECMDKDAETNYRIFGTDYNGYLKVKYRFGKFILYKNKKDHWKRKQLTSPVVNTKD